MDELITGILVFFTSLYSIYYFLIISNKYYNFFQSKLFWISIIIGMLLTPKYSYFSSLNAVGIESTAEISNFYVTPIIFSITVLIIFYIIISKNSNIQISPVILTSYQKIKYFLSLVLLGTIISISSNKALGNLLVRRRISESVYKQNNSSITLFSIFILIIILLIFYNFIKNNDLYYHYTRSLYFSGALLLGTTGFFPSLLAFFGGEKKILLISLFLFEYFLFFIPTRIIAYELDCYLIKKEEKNDIYSNKNLEKKIKVKFFIRTALGVSVFNVFLSYLLGGPMAIIATGFGNSGNLAKQLWETIEALPIQAIMSSILLSLFALFIKIIFWFSAD